MNDLDLPDFLDLPDLACARLGGEVLAANDDFFAEKENLVLDSAPHWDPDRYTDRGKWMDGWETRRRRDEGYDWCIVRLGLPGIVRGVVVDTAHFRGNYPESCSIEGCCLPDGASAEEVLAEEIEWLEILARAPLEGNSENRFAVDTPFRFTHLRLNIYPDGGVARLRVHGEVVPALECLTSEAAMDLLALEHGGRVLGASDRFFSSPENLLRPGDPTGMHDGWETKRRRGRGNDWAVFRLAAPGVPNRVEVDTRFFKGNAPGSCSIEALTLPLEDDARALEDDAEWQTLLPRTDLQPHHQHAFDLEQPSGPITHLRLQTYPDGGVARLRLWGVPDRKAAPALALRELNCLPPALAGARLLDCCGASTWAAAMTARRPFPDPASLRTAAEEEADRLTDDQWLEAFAAHPPIGGDQAERPRGETSARWSSQEQSGVAEAGDEVRARLAEANRLYRERFGYGFIVCATGKTAEEMLALIEERMTHDPSEEIAVAAEEEKKIMRLRLERLVPA